MEQREENIGKNLYYFSHHCDETPNRRHLREEGLILASHLWSYSPAWGRRRVARQPRL